MTTQNLSLNSWIMIHFNVFFSSVPHRPILYLLILDKFGRFFFSHSYRQHLHIYKNTLIWVNMSLYVYMSLYVDMSLYIYVFICIYVWVDMSLYVFSIQIENPCTLYKIFRRAYKFSKNRAFTLSVLTVDCHSQSSIQISSPEQSSSPSITC